MKVIKETVYPDTARGALDALRAMSDLDLGDARPFPDPVVRGVWGVDLRDGRRANRPRPIFSLRCVAGQLLSGGRPL